VALARRDQFDASIVQGPPPCSEQRFPDRKKIAMDSSVGTQISLFQRHSWYYPIAIQVIQ
jgi:hypothetical protein